MTVTQRAELLVPHPAIVLAALHQSTSRVARCSDRSRNSRSWMRAASPLPRQGSRTITSKTAKDRRPSSVVKSVGSGRALGQLGADLVDCREG